MRISQEEEHDLGHVVRAWLLCLVRDKLWLQSTEDSTEVAINVLTVLFFLAQLGPEVL